MSAINEVRRCKRRCNEDCIRRLAAHLCQLEHGGETSKKEPGEELEKVEYGDTCCDNAAREEIPAKESGCCASRNAGEKSQQDTSDSIGDACCSSKRSQQVKVKDPGDACCSGKEVHCACLKAIATEPAFEDPSGDTCCKTSVISTGKNSDCCTPSEREAKIDCSSTTSIECKEGCCDNPLPELPSSAKPTCSGHLKDAFDRYEALLRIAGCICRAVQNQFGGCCCATTPRNSQPASQGAASSRSSEPKPSSCENLVEKGCFKRASCCTSKMKPTSGVTAVEKGCSDQAQRHRQSITGRGTATDKPNVDVEKDAAREHVVIGVSGMTCTGCSRKIANVLDRTPGVSAAKVTFVTESAEFLLDTKTVTVEQTLRRIEKETGFKLNRISEGTRQLDILLPGVSAEEYACHLPDGATLERFNKRIFRVTYDPRVIGVRSLLAPGVELAPHAIDPKEEDGQRRLHGTTMTFAGALVLTIPILVLNWGRPQHVSRLAIDVSSFVLATFVQFISIPEFYVGALKSLVYSQVIEMDILVVLSISAAYLYSVVAFILVLRNVPLEQEPFFETATLLITLVLLGRLLSAYARARAVSAVAMRGMQLRTANLLLPDGNVEQIDARLLQFGDRFRVGAHSQVVTDGAVITGESAVDESMITGESIPVRKQSGDVVIAGTLNGPSELDCQLARLPGNNSISDIAGLVETAVESKPKVQDLADMLATYFVPCVMVIAIITFSIWIGVAVRVRGQNGGGAAGTAITYAVAVLAVSCPCAVGLAVPLVLVIAGGVAAKLGVVIKSALSVERGYQVTDVVFDKTGTLTTGELQVVTEQYLPHGWLSREQALGLVRSMVYGEVHPVSLAIAAFLSRQNPPLAPITVQAKTSIPGLGIEAIHNDLSLKAGSPHWLGVEDHPTMVNILSDGLTVFCVTANGQLIWAAGLRCMRRDEAAQVIEDLRSRNIDCHIVSGDNDLAVQQVGQTLGIPSTNIVARASPAEKQAYVQKLQKINRKVIFVGDGTNDAVAITQATIGMQIGTASEVTSAVADVVLLGGLNGIVQFLDLSKRAFYRIWFNFLWSAVYNTFAILLAAGAFVTVRIPPAYAGLGEIVSIAPVVGAAVTLVWKGRW